MRFHSAAPREAPRSKHPADEPKFDVFRALEELPNPRFEIPFNKRARFRGVVEALTEFNERVWGT